MMDLLYAESFKENIRVGMTSKDGCKISEAVTSRVLHNTGGHFVKTLPNPVLKATEASAIISFDTEKEETQPCSNVSQ